METTIRTLEGTLDGQLKEVEQADRDTEANMLRNLVTQIINDS